MQNNNQSPALQFEGEYNFGTEGQPGVYDRRTISLWFKVDELQNNQELVIYEENGTTEGLNIYVKDSRLFFDTWNQTGNEWSGSYASSNAITSDTWHHVGLILDRELENDFIAYLDGTNIDEGEGNPTDKVDVGIGGLSPSGELEEDSVNSGYSVKNIGVYDRVLTQAELELIFDPNYEPEPVKDSAVTIENTEVILLASRLLANDLDANGDRLTIKGVGNATDGQVAQNSDGNIIFTPAFGFSGEASFEYIVEDNAGKASTATVTVDVLSENRSVPIGTGLHRVEGVSPELPFLNGIKTAPGWLTQDYNVTTDDQGNFINVWNTAENNLLDLDENGWIKTIPDPEDDPQYSSVGMLLYRNLNYYPDGKYVVLYEGEGSIEYNFDARIDQSESAPGRHVLNVNPSSNGVWLRITDTDPNETGDYIRNIRVVPEEYEDIAEETYNPDFINTIANFDTLNYLNWAGINSSTEIEWSDRSTPKSSIFAEDLVSIEEMVELANQTQTNPWFHLPHQATDEYVTNFAEYVAENLNPELDVYLEYSHEIWNPSYDQARWIREEGEAQWSDNSFVGGFGKRLDWYSQRTVEVTQIWEEVFAEEKERVIGIVGGEAANTATIDRILEYNWAEDPLSNEEYGIDAIAIAPDTASYLENPAIADEVASWTTDSDGGIDKLFTELTEGGLVSNSPSGGAFQQAYDYTETYSNIADLENLDLITYEVGQKLPVNFGGNNNQAIKNLFNTAKRDPRMEELSQEYFTTLSETGADLSTSFNDPNAYNQWGSWWKMDENNLNGSTKLETITSLIAKNDYSLAPQIGVLESNLSRLNLILEGDSLELATNYTDVNTEEEHSFKLDWGDNSEVVEEQQDPLLGKAGDISASHIYDREGNYTVSLTITDQQEKVAQEDISFSVAKKITIDWKPYSTSQQTDLGENGQVQVAIFGREDFAVTDIEPTSVKASDRKNALLNEDGVSASADLTESRDVNGDGFADLIFSFDKAILRSAIATDDESMINDNELYLFGSNSALDSGFFLGME
ncbi:cadherin-like domain-containing protein [Waterburya agarophytonicola K14]|uniref:Cadherin-like domain-containing protein n=1 Tax=Waterburya agarophytonicola KI4 TaxID=2874699 RepID=A0A964BRX6_9CYAN|nr:cadherin-like domain-containing protein [Waterburya agarophytonicola]MCC0178519.1 cadherin-like domain-containing protein [Waterburya agarophytonicola KI4]